MTIAERVSLIKAGYSRAEINQMIEDERTAETIEEPTEAEVTIEPDVSQEVAGDIAPPAWASALQASLNDIVKRMEENARLSIEQPENDAMSASDEAIKKYLGG